MPNISEEEMKYYLENILKPTDTFSFNCQMCGKCCRKREEPIAMTGLDIFRICKALDKTTLGMFLTKIHERSYGSYISSSACIFRRASGWFMQTFA